MPAFHTYQVYFLFLFPILVSCNSNHQARSSSDSGIKETRDKQLHPKTYKKEDVVRSALQDQFGNIWFGTTNEGVFRFDGTTFTNFSEQDGLCGKDINAIIEDKDGTLWFGTNNGLCSYDGQSFEHFKIPWNGENDLWGTLCNPNQVLCLLEDNSGLLWLGTCGGGAFRFDGTSFTSFLSNQGRIQSDSLHHNVIKSIIEDREGNIWFTSLTHGGVSRYDGAQFTHFSAEDGLSYDMIYSSFQDKSGNIWFGSIMSPVGGLFRYNATSNDFTRFNTTEGLCDNFVTGIAEDTSGVLWLCTGGKACYYDGNTFTPFLTEDKQNLQDINFVIADDLGNIWLGGNYGQLFRYDGKTLTDFTDKKG
jgi:ligand-binding sensor domain-containing protein